MEAGVVMGWRELLAASIVGALAAIALPALASATCTGPEVTNDCELIECLVRQCKQEPGCWTKDRTVRLEMTKELKKCREQDREFDRDVQDVAPDCLQLKRYSQAQLTCIDQAGKAKLAEFDQQIRQNEAEKQRLMRKMDADASEADSLVASIDPVCLRFERFSQAQLQCVERFAKIKQEQLDRQRQWAEQTMELLERQRPVRTHCYWVAGALECTTQ